MVLVLSVMLAGKYAKVNSKKRKPERYLLPGQPLLEVSTQGLRQKQMLGLK